MGSTSNIEPIARAICGLGPVTSGSIRFAGSALTGSSNPAAAAGIAGIQIVFRGARRYLVLAVRYELRLTLGKGALGFLSPGTAVLNWL